MVCPRHQLVQEGIRPKAEPLEQGKGHPFSLSVLVICPQLLYP